LQFKRVPDAPISRSSAGTTRARGFAQQRKDRALRSVMSPLFQPPRSVRPTGCGLRAGRTHVHCFRDPRVQLALQLRQARLPDAGWKQAMRLQHRRQDSSERRLNGPRGWIADGCHVASRGLDMLDRVAMPATNATAQGDRRMLPLAGHAVGTGM